MSEVERAEHRRLAEWGCSLGAAVRRAIIGAIVGLAVAVVVLIMLGFGG